MLTVYSCIIFGHDLRLVVLAAAVCALASFAAITLLHLVRRSTKQMRNVWLGVSAIATGFGIWATHFIAMLAFTPGIPSAYNIALMVLLLVEAIMLTYAGLRIALAGFTGAPWVGGWSAVVLLSCTIPAWPLLRLPERSSGILFLWPRRLLLVAFLVLSPSMSDYAGAR